MDRSPDVEAFFEFIGVRALPAADGYRPAHEVRADYYTTGIHHYYDVKAVDPSGTARGTITFITPEFYPQCLWKGKRIAILEGNRIVGFATITEVFNKELLAKEK